MVETEFLTLTEPADLECFRSGWTGEVLVDRLRATGQDGTEQDGMVVGYSEDPAGLFVVWDNG